MSGNVQQGPGELLQRSFLFDDDGLEPAWETLSEIVIFTTAGHMLFTDNIQRRWHECRAWMNDLRARPSLQQEDYLRGTWERGHGITQFAVAMALNAEGLFAHKGTFEVGGKQFRVILTSPLISDETIVGALRDALRSVGKGPAAHLRTSFDRIRDLGKLQRGRADDGVPS